MRKKVMAFALFVMVLVGNILSVSANINDKEAVYSMRKGGEQIFYIEDSEGSVDKVIIEEIVGDKRASDNNYKITYETLNWRAGFYIEVQNNKITRAYSPFKSVLMGTIKSASLVHNSNTKATYAFLYKMTVWSEDTGVIASISNGEIKVSKR